MVVEKRYKVEGMMCGMCSAKLDDALCFARGVKRAEANHESGSLEIEYDDELITPEAIKQIAEGLGFDLHL